MPPAVLSAAFEMIALNIFTCGIILNNIASHEKRNYELRLIDYAERRGGYSRQG